MARELVRHRPARADAARGHRADPARAAGICRRGALARACAGPDGRADLSGDLRCRRSGMARCGVDLENPAFRGAGAVIDLLRDRAFTASGLGGFTSGWFTFGTLDWTSGANAGRRTEVLGHDVTDGIAVLTLLEAPVRAIAEGDGFTIRAGCDKRIGDLRREVRETLPISGASRTSPARTPCCATPRRMAGTREECCDATPRIGRPGVRHRHRAVMAGHAVPRPGQPARRRLRLPRARPGVSGARSSAPSRSRSRPTAATGARPARARCWPEGARRMMTEVSPAEAGPGALRAVPHETARRRKACRGS